MLMFLVIIYRLFAVVIGAVLVDNFNAGRVAGIFDNTNVATERASDAHTIWIDTEVDFTYIKIVKPIGEKFARAIVVAIETGISDSFINWDDTIRKERIDDAGARMANDENGTSEIIVFPIYECCPFDNRTPGWHVTIGIASCRNIGNNTTGDLFNEDIDI